MSACRGHENGVRMASQAGQAEGKIKRAPDENDRRFKEWSHSIERPCKSKHGNVPQDPEPRLPWGERLQITIVLD